MLPSTWPKGRFTGPVIVQALETAVDLDPRTGKAARARAIFNLHAATHRHRAFKPGGRATNGLNIAADRRPLLRPVDSQARILKNLNIAADIGLVKRARTTRRDDKVAGNGPGHRSVAHRLGPPRRHARVPRARRSKAAPT